MTFADGGGGGEGGMLLAYRNRDTIRGMLEWMMRHL